MIRKCCYINPKTNKPCTKRAIWVIWNKKEPFHEYFTESCDKHIANLLDDSPEFELFNAEKMY